MKTAADANGARQCDNCIMFLYAKKDCVDDDYRKMRILVPRAVGTFVDQYISRNVNRMVKVNGLILLI